MYFSPTKTTVNRLFCLFTEYSIVMLFYAEIILFETNMDFKIWVDISGIPFFFYLCLISNITLHPAHHHYQIPLPEVDQQR